MSYEEEDTRHMRRRIHHVSEFAAYLIQVLYRRLCRTYW
jgi:hypothetical protein